MSLSQAERERQEIDFWAHSEHEAPGKQSLMAFTDKMSEARVVLEKLVAYRSLFASATSILELGGGQGWASTLVAKEFEPPRLITTDISPSAVVSSRDWERVFQTELDGGLACRSYEIPVRDGGVDLVFVFAAAHHFGAHGRTLAELWRVLSPGGTAIYLHEPACRDYIYSLAHRRVMAKRPAVPEDLIRYEQLAKLATDVGFDFELQLAPTTLHRGPVETAYYLVLQRSRILRSWLPCSVDVILTKPGGEGS